MLNTLLAKFAFKLYILLSQLKVVYKKNYYNTSTELCKKQIISVLT